MASSLPKESDGGASPPSFSRPLSPLTGLFNVLGAAWTFALMLLISADVLGRAIFSHPIVGVTEIVSFSIVCIVFLQLARTVELGRVTRADSFLGSIAAFSPVLGAFLDFLAELGGLVLMAIIVYGVWPRLLSEYASNYFIGTPGMFTFPAWPIRAAIVAGATLAGMHFLIRAVRAAKAVFIPTTHNGAIK